LRTASWWETGGGYTVRDRSGKHRDHRQRGATDAAVCVAEPKTPPRLGTCRADTWKRFDLHTRSAAACVRRASGRVRCTVSRLRVLRPFKHAVSPNHTHMDYTTQTRAFLTIATRGTDPIATCLASEKVRAMRSDCLPRFRDSIAAPETRPRHAVRLTLEGENTHLSRQTPTEEFLTCARVGYAESGCT
jgi:hypothetical protein